MIRVLVLIAITGFFVGVVALSSAAAIGGPDLAARNWHWIDKWGDSTWRKHAKHDAEFDFDIDVDGPGGVTVTREIVWNGGAIPKAFVERARRDPCANGAGTLDERATVDTFSVLRHFVVSHGKFTVVNVRFSFLVA